MITEKYIYAISFYSISELNHDSNCCKFTFSVPLDLVQTNSVLCRFIMILLRTIHTLLEVN